MASNPSRGPCIAAAAGLHALDLVVDLGVEVAQTVQVLLGGVPVAAAVGLEEGGDHVAEGVGIGLEQALLHLRVGDEYVVSVLVDEVVDGAGGGGPAHGVAQPLGYLARALIARLEHALAHRLRERAHLRVGRSGVGDEGGRLLAVRAQPGDNLSRVGVEVVRDVRERDLARVEVLEGDVDLLERRAEDCLARVEHARLVGVEGEALARDELVLQLRLVLPAAILDGEADVGRVRAGGVGKDARRGLAQRALHLLGLVECVLAHEVHLEWLVELGGHLDGAVKQGHLVNEEVAEDTRAGDDHVDARPAELLQRDHLELVDAAERVGHRPDADHPQHLCERLAVGLDVVGAPQHKGHRRGVSEAVLTRLLLALEQQIDDVLGAVHGGRRRNGRRVQRVHVLAGGQHKRVADRVAAWAGSDELGVEALEQRSHLVVGDNLLEAELAVLEGLGHGLVGHLEANLLERLLHGRAAHHVLQAAHHGVDLGHAAVGVGGAVDRGAHCGAHAFGDLGLEGDVLEGLGLVELLDVLVERLGDDARQRLDLVLGPVDGDDIDQRGDGLFGRGRHAYGVQATRQQARLDLHDLAVDLAHDVVFLQLGAILHVDLVRRQVDVLVKVALARRRDDRADNVGGAAGEAQALVRADELA
eukprot:scaffold6584_cov98-Phaeocystis_antarctica.AAC.2